MNPVEIEEAITELAEHSFDAQEFPYAFLEAFGNKATTLKRLRSGASNKSDIGGVLQANHIHLKTCDTGQVPETLNALRDSKATETKRNKVRFLLATDGKTFEAEDLNNEYIDIKIVKDKVFRGSQNGYTSEPMPRNTPLSMRGTDGERTHLAPQIARPAGQTMSRKQRRAHEAKIRKAAKVKKTAMGTVH